MARDTRATRALTAANVDFTVHAYAYDPLAERAGLQAARELGEDPARVLKTLMVLLDVLAGFIVTIVSARRDLDIGRQA